VRRALHPRRRRALPFQPRCRRLGRTRPACCNRGRDGGETREQQHRDPLHCGSVRRRTVARHTSTTTASVLVSLSSPAGLRVRGTRTSLRSKESDSLFSKKVVDPYHGGFPAADGLRRFALPKRFSPLFQRSARPAAPFSNRPDVPREARQLSPKHVPKKLICDRGAADVPLEVRGQKAKARSSSSAAAGATTSRAGSSSGPTSCS